MQTTKLLRSLGARCTLFLLGVMLLLTGCGSGTASNGTVSTGGSGSGSGSGSGGSGSGSPAAKLPLHGLVSMNGEPFVDNTSLLPDNTQSEPNANPGVYVASVLLVTWDQLQPTSGVALDTSAIESGLAAIAAYNAANPKHPMVAKLRVFAGFNTPQWAMQIDGGPVTATLHGATAALPKFWTADYAAAWTNLQNLLAATYDDDPRIGEVAVSGCSSHSAEPFIFTSDPTVIATVQAAGYTDAQYQSCLSTMATQYAAWKTTPLDYTFNSFIHVDTGKPVYDTAFPIALMTTWRTTLGTARGILANHGLQTTLTNDAQTLYAEFPVLGPPLEFQTITPGVDWNSTIAFALTYHPSEIEIWPTTQGGGSAQITLTQLQTWAAEL